MCNVIVNNDYWLIINNYYYLIMINYDWLLINTQRYLLCNQTSLSHWLTAMSVMNATSLRYMKPLLQLPSHCDGCGSPFSTSHALDCRKGGLVTQRHNEIRDLIHDLVWSQTTKEPIVQEGSTSQDALVADIGVRGVWQYQSYTLFDIRFVDSDTPSYLGKTPKICLEKFLHGSQYNKLCTSNRSS